MLPTMIRINVFTADFATLPERIHHTNPFHLLIASRTTLMQLKKKNVSCNLCQLICPVEDCITMVVQRKGDEYLNWKDFQRLGMKLNDH
jgi:formate hydrogenlyase subunit 6/NADH:ubiquinone oxidoreductase subunit I